MPADQQFHSNAVLIGHVLHMCFPPFCLLYELHICLDPQIVVFLKNYTLLLFWFVFLWCWEGAVCCPWFTTEHLKRCSRAMWLQFYDPLWTIFRTLLIRLLTFFDLSCLVDTLMWRIKFTVLSLLSLSLFFLSAYFPLTLEAVLIRACLWSIHWSQLLKREREALHAVGCNCSKPMVPIMSVSRAFMWSSEQTWVSV